MVRTTQAEIRSSEVARLLFKAGVRWGEEGDGKSRWSVRGAAELAGVTRPTMTRYADFDLGPIGRRPYDPPTLRKIAEAFGISWSDMRAAAERDAGNVVTDLGLAFMADVRSHLATWPAEDQIDLAKWLLEQATVDGR